MEQYYKYLPQIISILTPLLTIIAVYQTYKSRKLSKKIAKLQGVFKQSNITLRMAYDLEKHDVDHFVFAFQLSRGSVFEIPMIFLIKNIGDKTAKNVEVLIRFPKTFWYNGRSRYEFKVDGRIELKQCQHDVVQKNDFFQTLDMIIPSIRPNELIKIYQDISIKSDTVVNVQTEFTTADGVNVLAKLRSFYYYQVNVTVFAENSNPIAKTFFFGIIDISEKSVKEWFEWYNKLFNSQSCGKNNNSFLQKIARCFRGYRLYHLFYLFTHDDIDPEKKEFKKSNLKATIFRPKGLKGCIGFCTEKGFDLPAYSVSVDYPETIP